MSELCHNSYILYVCFFLCINCRSWVLFVGKGFCFVSVVTEPAWTAPSRGSDGGAAVQVPPTGSLLEGQLEGPTSPGPNWP